MYDIDLIKEQLSVDNIISILDSFDCPVFKVSQTELVFPSICHHRNDFLEHKPKLYYYILSKRFKCYSCGRTFDIFGLVQHISNCNFTKAMEIICRISCITFVTKEKTQLDNWRSIKRFLPTNDYQDETPIRIFDKKVLSCLKKYYHQSWLDDGISKETMGKFDIGWYAPKQQITIPVKDIDGNLIGIHCRNTKKRLVDKGLKYQPLKTLNEDYRFPTGKALYGLYEQRDRIMSTGNVTLFEAPKSVLQFASFKGVQMGHDETNGLAMFGWNCNKARRDLLLSLHIREVTIALDRQYQNINNQEFQIYCHQVKKIIQLFKPYCDVYVIWDKDCNLIDYKDSPTDRGIEIWNKLYGERVKV